MEYANTFSNKAYQWFFKEQNINNIKQLSDNQILNIANEINGLFAESSITDNKMEINLPRLVVVGTQSSGKSSVLNSIISMDILPTGQNMVTRSPLEICLQKMNKTANEGSVEFGDYSENGWEVRHRQSIKVPIPTEDEVHQIREFIKKRTIELAGEGMNITTRPIILKICSPFVPNLSLTDLPGLTMVPCLDKGQPADIKERIENLVSSYLKRDKTIIIGVMQSRSDLETDLGLALIKTHDPEGKRTIGVLTKPDLMNTDTHIGDYLINNISQNLMLNHGYYVIRNRNNKESKEVDILKTAELEKAYFTNHPEYKKSIYQNKIGIGNLTNNLNKILVTSITDLFPIVMSEILLLETKLNKKLDNLGQEVPNSKEGKISILNKYISNFYNKVYNSLESKGQDLNSGKKIKSTFISYRTDLHKIKPFNNSSIYNQKYFENLISNFEGNHMSFQLPPIEVLEACFTDEKHNPIRTLKDISAGCADSICELFVELFKDILKLEEFAQFPQLTTNLLSLLLEEVIIPLRIKTKEKIFDAIKIEEDYIWTDTKDFNDFLLNFNKNMKFDCEMFKNLLEIYFSTIKTTIANTIPKIIMSFIVREIEKTLLTYLLEKMVVDEKINLLKQDEKIEKQRKYYRDMKLKIDLIKKNFSING